MRTGKRGKGAASRRNVWPGVFRRSALTAAVSLFTCGCPAAPSAPCSEAPAPAIVLPGPDELVTGVLSVQVQDTSCRATADIAQARFEVRPTGGEFSEVLADPRAHGLTGGRIQSGIWSARWDSQGATSSGGHEVRAILRAIDGVETASAAVPFSVNFPPGASATIVAGTQPRSIDLDATSSSDTEGPVTSWTWDLGDGTTGTGTTLTHTYNDVSVPHDVSLEVSDGNGALSWAYYEVGFLPAFSVQEKADCTCLSIEVRHTPGDEALGPDGKPGGKTWSIGLDGKTLGPAHDNGGNPEADSEKEKTGYAVEIVATVKGDPKLCGEGQLTRRTSCVKGQDYSEKACVKRPGSKWNAANKCCEEPATYYMHWTKQVDINRDGNPDYRATTQQECDDIGGLWSQEDQSCTILFPKDGKFGPDDVNDGVPGKFMTEKWTLKEHAGNKIVWFDVPGLHDLDNGSTYEADWLSFIRNSNGTYCYRKWSGSFERKAGKDKEDVQVEDEVLGAAALPET